MEKKTVIIEATEAQIAALVELGFEPVQQDIATVESNDTDIDMISPIMADSAQEQAIEPENVDKVEVPSPFVRAQISTKNQMILRNILALLSSLGVVIVFILEKLGVM